MSIAKFSQVLATAHGLAGHQKVLSGAGLAILLNQMGYRTVYGTPYCGGRGTYRLISLTYEWCVQSGNASGAEIVAESFVNARGVQAWK
ncbi:MAG: hypothetical protein RL173_1103 [Fibrobacterota bacterium]|jgi:hypothetical protein